MGPAPAPPPAKWSSAIVERKQSPRANSQPRSSPTGRPSSNSQSCREPSRVYFTGIPNVAVLRFIAPSHRNQSKSL